MLPAREERVEGVELGTVADVASSVRELGLDVEAPDGGCARGGLSVTWDKAKGSSEDQLLVTVFIMILSIPTLPLVQLKKESNFWSPDFTESHII